MISPTTHATYYIVVSHDVTLFIFCGDKPLVKEKKLNVVCCSAMNFLCICIGQLMEQLHVGNQKPICFFVTWSYFRPQ
jgi:hypothetical protein